MKDTSQRLEVLNGLTHFKMGSLLHAKLRQDRRGMPVEFLEQVNGQVALKSTQLTMKSVTFFPCSQIR